MSGDGHGTPIRLHFDAGHFSSGDESVFPPMELTAISMALSVNRIVGGMPMPFTGGRRFGIDLNMVNSVIVIDGIFADDDVNRRVSSPRAASAVIDFAVESADNIAIGSFTPVVNNKFGDLNNVAIKQISGGTIHVIYFSRIATASYFTNIGVTNVKTEGGITRIYMHPTTYLTPAQMAASLATALGASHRNADISTSITTSDFYPVAGSSKITLTQTVNGPITTASVIFNRNGSGTYKPHHNDFSGGSLGSAAASIKSGGDKVQDLYGILHNTDRGTASILVGAAIGVAAVAATVSTGGLAAIAIGAGAAVAGAGAGAVISRQSFYNGDYPIGIQIPYNSMVTSAGGQKYALRNFLIPTGLSMTTNDKISDSNDHDANKDFDTWDNTTGIQGTIQKLEVSYNAGEQHYTYQMVFAPIDAIL